MTTEQLLQEVQELRTQALTPVSPKPIHFPQPSNIPLLDISMDPEFDTSAPPSAPTTHPVEPGASEGGPPKTTESITDTTMDGYNNNGSLETETIQSSEAPTDHATTARSIDQAHPDNEAISAAIKTSLDSSVPYPSTSAPPLNDAALAFLQSLVMSSAVSAANTPSASNPFAQPSMPSQASSVPANEPQHDNTSPDDVVMENGGADVVNHDVLSDRLATPEVSNQVQAPNTNVHDSDQKDAVAQDTGPPGIHQTPIRLIPTVPSLPARPPVQQTGSDVRSQQPNDQSSASQYGHVQTSLHAPTDRGNSISAGPTPGQQQHGVPSTPATQQQQEMSGVEGSHAPEPEDEPFSPELQKLYDDFLADERNNMTINEWDKFPIGSRLFIGNLPSEKVTKPDIFRVFHKHGKLAQISIKQAYGFAQYYAAEACARALEVEQAVAIRGRKIHLEVSKPQRNKNQQNDNRRSNNQQRRSRSPEYGRGSVDRYRNNDNRQGRGRDGYRPRSPSPRRGYGRRSPDRYDSRRRSRSRTPPGRYPNMDHRPAFDDDCPLPRRRPEQIPDIQIISQQPPERSFIQYVERAFESRGVKCDVLLLSPRLPEAGVLRRQIIEGVHAVMKLEKPVQYTNKFPLSIFDRSTPGNVRFEEYQDLDLPICVELVLRAKQNAVRVSTPVPQQYSSAPPAMFPYGNQAVPPALPPPPMPAPSQYMQNNLQRGAPPPPLPPMPLPSQLDAASIQRLLGQLPPPTPQGYPFAPPQPGQGQPPLPLPTTADLARLLASAGTQTPQTHQHQQQHQSYGVPPPPLPPATSYAPPNSAQAQSNANTNANAYQSLLSNPALAALLKGSAPPTQQQGQQYHGQQQGQQQQNGGGVQGQGQQSDMNMQNIMAKLARYG